MPQFASEPTRQFGVPGGGQSTGNIPSTAAAARLGRTVSKFNRKLDNVYDKFTRHGVRGLDGDATRLASARQARLVEYALVAHIVNVSDLDLLPPMASSAAHRHRRETSGWPVSRPRQSLQTAPPSAGRIG